jgi:hypothetical protein
MSSSLELIAIRCFAWSQTEHRRERAGFFRRAATFPTPINERSDFSRESAGSPQAALGLRYGMESLLPRLSRRLALCLGFQPSSLAPLLRRRTHNSSVTTDSLVAFSGMRLRCTGSGMIF